MWSIPFRRSGSIRLSIRGLALALATNHSHFRLRIILRSRGAVMFARGQLALLVTRNQSSNRITTSEWPARYAVAGWIR
ncbi:hypothetical protein F5J12DRAFT_864530 [Pisolithus orientalis]|uniref:uncharacterized protein n=1 Tax=Pisolithus orientalis TaxID=936130 RepID=UPI002224BCF5|nr:uncharacterized protein F5J12DRAFT_864530 [Pisolithus orientalis]KAI5989194.1 hypothetical protein F5J12DRAFT_864530 [Pisolithus orientalis]